MPMVVGLCVSAVVVGSRMTPEMICRRQLARSEDDARYGEGRLRARKGKLKSIKICQIGSKGEAAMPRTTFMCTWDGRSSGRWDDGPMVTKQSAALVE